VKLLDFISEIEKCIGKTAKKEYLPMQDGDVEYTWANVDSLVAGYGYKPTTSIKDGVKEFVKWFKVFYNKK
jgi:UDP-glucuronate 4-epimerase